MINRDIFAFEAPSVPSNSTAIGSIGSARPLPGLWSIVLAGGAGNRVRPFIQEWLGRSLPKQYCTFTGTRSLLQHTLDRARRLAPDERTLVVIDQTHRQFAEPQLSDRPSVRVIHQPCNCDTAPGIFLPLTYIRRMDSDAMVVIYPSDHFIFPEERFIAVLREAASEGALIDRVVLLGVVPDQLELEYGWIQPGSPITKGWPSTYSVRSFVEKPALAEAKAAMEAGALWNTFVLLAKVERLWELGWTHLPEMMPHFEQLGRAIGSSNENEVLRSMYTRMPVRNFSSDLLQRAPEHVGVVKLENLHWSDWGNPERILQSLRSVGARRPLQSMRLAVSRWNARPALNSAAS